MADRSGTIIQKKSPLNSDQQKDPTGLYYLLHNGTYEPFLQTKRNDRPTTATSSRSTTTTTTKPLATTVEESSTGNNDENIDKEDVVRNKFPGRDDDDNESTSSSLSIEATLSINDKDNVVEGESRQNISLKRKRN
jgi:hypothetical protein